MTQATVPVDALAEIAGITPDSPIARLRATRPEIVRHTQATFLAIFEPSDDSELSRTEREAAAVHFGTLTQSPELTEWHRQRLQATGPAGEQLAQIGTTFDPIDLTLREQAILRHVELLTLRPATATDADIRALEAAGLSPAAIVTLAQLVAFLSFEIRAIAALRAIAGQLQP